jgi:hypothetical protein
MGNVSLNARPHPALWINSKLKILKEGAALLKGIPSLRIALEGDVRVSSRRLLPVLILAVIGLDGRVWINSKLKI